MEFTEFIKYGLMLMYAAFGVVAIIEIKEKDYKQAFLSIAICACLILAIFLI